VTVMLRVALGIVGLLFAQAVVAADNPLSSWNDGPAKKAILEFVAAVTDENTKDYVPAEERIAVFDNDGTLWVEYPIPEILALLDIAHDFFAYRHNRIAAA